MVSDDSDHIKPTIMLVDDTPANLDLLGQILTDQYVVRQQPNGILALLSAQAEPPDLILLDVKMPGMNGYEVCKKLKANPQTHAIPVIFISALQDTQDKIAAFSSGGVDYISKPFQTEEVLARVKTHLQLYHLQTELKQRNQQLAQAKEAAEAANRAKSAFLANMSHELRTPLNAVLGFAQILEQDPDLNSRQRHEIKSIHQGGNYLLTLINDVLDLSKIEANRFELFPKPCHISGFFNDLTDLFRIRAEQKGLRLVYRPEAHLPSLVELDERRLRQICMNLLGNAVKFTRQGQIEIKVSFQQAHLQIAVCDTGPGISEDELEKIFEPFQQAGGAEDRIQGTGLGLAISQKLVHLMDGELTVKSTLGQGTCFQIDLPIKILDLDQSSASDVHQLRRQHKQVIGHQSKIDEPYHLLVTDDMPDNRELLVTMLENLGFVVTQATGGSESLAIVERQTIHLILMDLRMPEMNGIEVVKKLRSDARFAEIPIIMVSGSVFADNRVKSLAAGCNAFLPKPIEYKELLDTLAELLQLEWLYDDQINQQSEQSDQEEMLPKSAYERLAKLVSSGYLEDIVAFSEELLESGHCPSLAKQIHHFATTFDIGALRQLIQRQKNRLS